MGTISDMLSSLDFSNFIFSLQQGGWFDFVFPFMLVYAVVFTILNNVGLFKDKKAVKVIIALVFALFAIAFPITDNTSCGFIGTNYQSGVVSGCTLGALMMTLFPGVTAFAFGILALYIVIAMLGVDLTKFFGDDNDKNNYLKWILGFLGLIVVLYYYALGFGWDGFSSSGELNAFFTDPFLYILILFGVFFWWVTKDEKGNNDETEVEKTITTTKK